MNALSNIHEERKQAHADLAIADEMRDLIHNYFGVIWMAAMAKANDVSLSQREHLVEMIESTLGRNAADDVVTELTFKLRNGAIDLVGESIIRQRPKRHPAEHLPS